MGKTIYHIRNFEFFVVLVALVTMPVAAQAYIDPGAGSLAIQAILASVAGVAVAFRQVRAQIRGWIARCYARFKRPAD